MQCHELAITMPSDGFGLNPEMVQNEQRASADGAQSRLRDGCASQSIFMSRSGIFPEFRPGIYEITQPRSIVSPGQAISRAVLDRCKPGVVCLREHFLHLRKLTRQISKHTKVLRSLAGKHKGKLPN